ncbi:hypothetical protein GCM10027084_02320 [Pseudoxanthomonas sangjuensis]|uniref:hypothetical protein n=1 Tax=Pseudoxanthomonas sangjuensis TaxID=1503750 RepID=UPI0013920663|nr:hypothetical protein [Pseudoxanthomonas sangjuensis]
MKRTKKPLVASKPESVPSVLEALASEKATQVRAKGRAFVAVNGVASNARAIQEWQKQAGMPVPETLAYTFDALDEMVQRSKRGDSSDSEMLLLGQAAALNAVFAALLGRAQLNMGEFPEAFESYMRLALRAQFQSQATLRTLSEIKAPRSVAFIQQANVANGPQQVNNGVSARGGGMEMNPPNEKLEVVNGQWVDAGAQGSAIGSYQTLEAVGEDARPGDGGRQAAQQPERMERRRAANFARVGADASGAGTAAARGVVKGGSRARRLSTTEGSP